MSNVLFPPWIGSLYETEGFRGLKVLILSESHYGPARMERPSVTPETIKALAMGRKHSEAKKRKKLHTHFAKIITSLHGAKSASEFGMSARRDFWEHVAYFNYFQMRFSTHRQNPPDSAWEPAARALNQVLEALNPDLLLVFSKRVGLELRASPLNVPMAWVHHPSSSAFTYEKCNPRIATALESAVAAREASLTTSSPVVRHTDLQKWLRTSETVQPCHGGKLTPERNAEEFARWAKEMQQARELFEQHAAAPASPSP